MYLEFNHVVDDLNFIFIPFLLEKVNFFGVLKIKGFYVYTIERYCILHTLKTGEKRVPKKVEIIENTVRHYLNLNDKVFID